MGGLSWLCLVLYFLFSYKRSLSPQHFRFECLEDSNTSYGCDSNRTLGLVKKSVNSQVMFKLRSFADISDLFNLTPLWLHILKNKTKQNSTPPSPALEDSQSSLIPPIALFPEVELGNWGILAFSDRSRFVLGTPAQVECRLPTLTASLNLLS